MKKIIVALLLSIVLVGSVFAADFKFNVGIKNTGLNVTVTDSNGKLNGDTEFNIDTEFDMFFKNGLGMNIIFGTEKFSTYNVGVGFAYNIPINSNWDFVLSVGPIFGFTGDKDNTFGIFSHFDFDFIVGKYFYARIGTGLDIDFLTFGDGQSDVNFEMLIPIPRVAIGWKF